MEETYRTTGKSWDKLGDMLTKAGNNDTPKDRYLIGNMLGKKEFVKIASVLKITKEQVENLYNDFVNDFGGPY